MLLRDATRPLDFPELRIDAAMVRLLWAEDWFDGPLCGMAEVSGEGCWFQFVEEADDERADGWYRRYWLIRLSPEEVADEEYWHGEFTKYVNSRYDFTRSDNVVHPQSEWPKFYDRAASRTPRDLGGNPVIGWHETNA